MNPGPYIVTAQRDGVTLERVAVGTLADARRVVWRYANVAYDGFAPGGLLDDLGAAGGAVGPLPDDVVVIVQESTFPGLRSAAGLRPNLFNPPSNAEIIDAYNKQQSKGGA